MNHDLTKEHRRQSAGRRTYGFLAVVSLLCLLAVALPDILGATPKHDAPARSSTAPTWADDIPLWRDAGIPLDAFAVLEEGVVRKTRWGVYAFRGKKTDTPCLALVDLYFGGGKRAVSVHSERRCRPVTRLERSPMAVHLGYQYQERADSPLVGAEAIGFGVAPDVMRLSAQLVPGGQRTLTTRILSPRQARKARVDVFRYVAFGVAREVCIGETKGLDSAGEVVVSASPEQCSGEGDGNP